MKKRIFIVADADPNLVAKLSYILSKVKINIDDINVVTLSDKMYVELEVNDVEKTIAVLRSNGFEPSIEESIMVQLEDRPGTLAEVANLLSENHIAITKVCVIGKEAGKVLVSIQVDKNRKARKLLKKYLP